MKELFIVCLCVVALGCGSSQDREPDHTGGVVHIENRLEHAVCSGSLIAANAVLTARHCVAPLTSGDDCASRTLGENYEPQHFRVSFTKPDAHDLRLDDKLGETSDVRMVLTPENGRTNLCGTDMAILILSRRIPAAVAEPLKLRYEPMAQSHEAVQLVGFGATKDANHRERTNSWGMVTCRSTSCEVALSLAEWQADPYGCYGDSGGPLLDGDNKVLGVATGMRLQDTNARCSNVMIATATAYYADFIKESLDIASAL